MIHECVHTLLMTVTKTMNVSIAIKLIIHLQMPRRDFKRFDFGACRDDRCRRVNRTTWHDHGGTGRRRRGGGRRRRRRHPRETRLGVLVEIIGHRCFHGVLQGGCTCLLNGGVQHLQRVTRVKQGGNSENGSISLTGTVGHSRPQYSKTGHSIPQQATTGQTHISGWTRCTYLVVRHVFRHHPFPRQQRGQGGLVARTTAAACPPTDPTDPTDGPTDGPTDPAVAVVVPAAVHTVHTGRAAFRNGHRVHQIFHAFAAFAALALAVGDTVGGAVGDTVGSVGALGAGAPSSVGLLLLVVLLHEVDVGGNVFAPDVLNQHQSGGAERKK